MGKNKYSVGSKFNQLIIEKIYSGSRPLKWKMRCECGVSTIVFASNVVSNKSRKCIQCSNKEKSQKKLHNLKNEKFGFLTLIQYDYEKKKWLCKCECGEYCYRGATGLRYNKKKGLGAYCGTCNRKTGKIKTKKLSIIESQRKRREKTHEPILNKKFRNYKILELVYNKKGNRNRSLYKCRCKCKNIFYIRTDSLEKVFSCGCYQRTVAGKRKKLMSDEDTKIAFDLFQDNIYSLKEISKLFNVRYDYIWRVINKYKKEKGE